jgi:hypothetical protein
MMIPTQPFKVLHPLSTLTLGTHSFNLTQAIYISSLRTFFGSEPSSVMRAHIDIFYPRTCSQQMMLQKSCMTNFWRIYDLDASYPPSLNTPSLVLH